MWLRKLSNSLEIVVNPLALVFKGGGMAVLAGMMFLTASDVCLRYVFNSPIPGAYEIITFMMGIIIPFAMIFTASKRAHIAIDLVIEHLPKRLQKILAVITTFLTFILFLLITWQAFYYIFEEYDAMLTSAVLLIPTWPFILLFFLAVVLLTAVVFIDFIQRLSEVSSKWTRSSSE